MAKAVIPWEKQYGTFLTSIKITDLFQNSCVLYILMPSDLLFNGMVKDTT